jgi:flavin reductase (DIM6/NTAB) family NADH-FMN oxidoreductase RutF
MSQRSATALGGRTPVVATSTCTIGQVRARDGVMRQNGMMEPLSDELLNQVTWRIPNALALIGSAAGDEWNAMTASWITQVSMEPVLIGVGVDNNAVTHRLINAGGSFSVNLWSADDTRVFVKFSKPAERDGSTLNGRPVTTAATGAPIFEEAVAWMDCEVRQAIDFGTHTFFVGEIVAAAVVDPDANPAAITDTRMKYGGVKRGGH